MCIVFRVIRGMARRLRQQVANRAMDELKCDILLFFATQTEREQLERGTSEFGVSFEERMIIALSSMSPGKKAKPTAT